MKHAASWDGRTAGELAELLGVPEVHIHEAVDSTQDIAHELAQRGAPAGAVVLADSQRAGRGRLGRPWSSPPRAGVWCTLVARPTDAAAIAVLSLRTGLYVASGLDSHAGEQVRLKWPNDLMLRAGKVGGILVESRWSGLSAGWAAVGIGVNLSLPPEVAGAAAMPAGTERLPVLQVVIRGALRASAATGFLTADELNWYHARDILSGRRIVHPESGTVRGVTASGELLVETSQGVRRLRAGSVEMAEEGP